MNLVEIFVNLIDTIFDPFFGLLEHYLSLDINNVYFTGNLFSNDIPFVYVGEYLENYGGLNLFNLLYLFIVIFIGLFVVKMLYRFWRMIWGLPSHLLVKK